MFYAFSYLPTAKILEVDAVHLPMPLAAGIIHQVDVLFQDGCNHQTFIRIEDSGFQIWPTNKQEKLRGNATAISFRDFYELKPGDSTLTAVIWTDLTAAWAEVIVQIGLLPKRIIQPMSFDELLAAAAGIV